MAITANTVIARAQRVYADLDSASALAYLNDVDEEVLSFVPWRRSSRAVGLTAGTGEYALLETEIKVWVARYLYDGTFASERHLSETSFDTLDADIPGWRGADTGTPASFYISSNSSTGVIGLYPAPDSSSLVVSGATNATPIVMTTGTHGLADGDMVYQKDVGGNTAANGRFYAKVTGYSSTTYALYSDSDLTTAVAGSGAYTSGGYVAAPSHPMAIVETTQRTDYTGSENFPTIPHLRDLYVAGICRRFAMERDHDKLAMWDSLFKSRLAEFSRMYWSRSAKFRQEAGPALSVQNRFRT